MSKIHQIHKITATAEPDVYIIDLDLTDMDGEVARCDYCTRPGDPYGANPEIREWLTANSGSYTIEPYVEPTADEIRANMRSITKRQLSLALIRNGFSLAAVSAAIAAMPEGQAKDEAEIEWEYTTDFERLNPTLLNVASALGLTPEQVDAMWEQALTI
ncbi:hypothetical protein KX729_09130 [Rhizobium sp. XQZ8]|uniref:hypothetical protein n=1 Tax=Rhizobium populisoli TaxID=2859785 RepID=UPI001CA5A73F|nr:hypothetical protein [Rhizobium populisoli]MBW6421601.1 hypothetical protein [Rhizobium populisoli]